MKKTVGLKSGFTLLEILLVVGIISILAGIVILAINPTKQLGDTRNAQRRADVLTIINAIYQYSLDEGVLPNDLGDEIADEGDCYTVDEAGIGTANTESVLASTLTDLTASSTYLSQIPDDPSLDGSGDYSVVLRSSGRVTVCAPAAENMADDTRIEVTR